MTKYSVTKPYTVLVGVVLSLVLGVVSFLGLKTDLLPTMDLPYVVVYTVYPGASPERVETSVTQVVEGAVATTSGLENMSSISSENMSMVILEFSQSANMDSVMLELSTNLDTVTGYFDDMVQKPVMMKINPNMLPVQMVSVDADGMDIKQLTEYINTTLSPRIERLDGVATVDVSGGVEDRVDIFLNQEKIDKVNDKLLKAINSQLYDTKVELDKAKRELTDAENQLKQKEQDTYNQLADATVKLDDGMAQLNAVTGEKTQLEAQKGLIEGAQKALAGLAQLRGGIAQIQRGIARIDEGIAKINEGITKIDTTLAALSGFTAMPDIPGVQIPPEATFRDIIKALNAVRPDKAAGLSAIIAASNGAIKDTDTPAGLIASLTRQKGELEAKKQELEAQRPRLEEQLKNLQRQETALVATLKEMGVNDETIASVTANLERKAENYMTRELTEVKEKLTAATFLANQLQEQVTKLQETKKALEAGKMQAASGMAVGKVQVSTLKEKVESGQKEFESARDSALAQANIDSLVTQSMLANILTAQNFSMPAGYISEDKTKFTVKVGDVFSELSQLENLLLVDMGVEDMPPIYLSDVADVEINDNSRESYVRINGNPAVILSVSKSSTASTAEVSDLVNKELREICRENPAVHVTGLMDQGMYIDMIVGSVLKNLRYGGILAIIVLLFFLRDFKPTVIIAFAIPISLLVAVVRMYFSNVTLNIMSLSGLSLAVGMLVDNSVVVIENIYRLRNLGYTKAQAAVAGAKQVAGAITASTLTTICVFLPIVFTDGISRQLFTDMGLTIAYSLIASLIVALTLVPAMSSTMLDKTKSDEGTWFGRLTDKYVSLLEWNMKHKAVVLSGAAALLIFSLYSATKMPMTLIPSMDSTQMSMDYVLPATEYTEEQLIADSEKIARRVREIDGVETVGLMKGGSGISAALSSSSSNNLSMTFYVVLSEDKELSNQEIASIIKEKTADYSKHLTVSASTMDISAVTGSGLSIVVKGTDLDTLQATAGEIAERVKGVEGIAKVSDGSENSSEELRIDVDKTEAMKYGLTVAQVFQKVSDALTETKTATTLTIDSTDMKAVIHAAATYDREEISDLVVTTAKEKDKNGKEVEKDITLGQIATLYMGESPKSINRDNGSRYKTVTMTLADGYNATLVARDVEEAMRGYSAPKGYSYEMSGENETTMNAMKDMLKMLGLACIFIYLIMVAQFQSLKSPFIVIFTIPLAFTGGLLSLLISGKELSVVAMVGFLVLSGVVVNNGIVFVDYINQLRLSGTDKLAAILQTGRDRIKPVLMTALTTIFANAIMALAIGMGAEMSQGMAIVTMGGLAYATLLTLFVVPALYDIFNKKEMKKIEVDIPDETV